VIDQREMIYCMLLFDFRRRSMIRAEGAERVLRD